MAFCYVLYSQSLDRFYIGCTHDEIGNRLEKHLSKVYGEKKYTAKADDWEVYLNIVCLSFTQAIKLENHIKKMKSKKYIQDMKEFPEMAQKLLIKYPA
jgi:putative endonuclease